jgi:hypothetical protein
VQNLVNQAIEPSIGGLTYAWCTNPLTTALSLAQSNSCSHAVDHVHLWPRAIGSQT